MKGYINKYVKSLLLVATLIISTTLISVPAFAHVGVTPNTAEQGSYGTFSIKVPNESATASTIKIELQIPTENPIKSVSIQPVTGWNYTLEKTTVSIKDKDGVAKDTEVVTKITWEGGEIKPGEFQIFPISMGALPTDSDSIVLKAIQTYSDGEVARWIDVADQAGEELEKPAPVITLTKSTGDDHSASAKSNHDGEDKKVRAETKDDDNDDDDDSNTVLEYGGIVLGTIALLLGGYAVAKKK
jgi:periplasmic copper chaperone A